MRSIHEKGLIYRDIKPDNFLIGTQDPSRLFLIDFGMAKPFRDPHSGQHIQYREKKSLSGTARYMSINTHLGREQSRRDDLESVGHVMFYLLRGSLPWQGLKAASNKEKYERIGIRKQATLIRELLLIPQQSSSNNSSTSQSVSAKDEDSRLFPWEFGRFLEYCRELAFDAEPDYAFLCNLMRSVISTCTATKKQPNSTTTGRRNSIVMAPPLDWVARGIVEVSVPSPFGLSDGEDREAKKKNQSSNAAAAASMTNNKSALKSEGVEEAEGRRERKPWYRRLFCLD